MINYVDGQPTAEAGVAGSEASSAETVAAAASTTGASDSIATGAAFAAPAYLPYGAAPRGFTSSASAASGAYEPETVDADATRFGSQYALIRAALPRALQNQLDAQVTAAANSLAGGDAAADEGRPAFSESDLARLVRSSISDSDDGAAGVLVARLARTIARYGAASVSGALRLADDRIVFAAAGASPATLAQHRVRRHAGDRNRERERHQWGRKVPDETADSLPAGSDAGPGAITDTVYFGGTPVATLNSPLPALNVERKPL